MNIFSKIAEGLRKTRQAIGFAFKQLFKKGVFGDEFYDELEALLLSADVGATAADEIIQNLRQKMAEAKIADSEQAEGFLREIIFEMLDFEPFDYQSPCVILVSGVNGVGKTTTIGKLAHKFTAEGKSVILAAADTFRAAASDQLEVWAKRANVRLVRQGEGADPAAVVFDAMASAKSRSADIIIVDTAGRLHNKQNLMEELKKINRVIGREMPNAQRQNLLVLDATTGQNGLAQAQVFDEAVDLDRIVLTKLDGTAKGGIVLSIASNFGLPVRFVGVGEAIDDLQPFDARAYADSLL